LATHLLKIQSGKRCGILFHLRRYYRPIKATEEVKADMETAIPMERLICGDVGFGKQKWQYEQLLKQ